MEEAKALGKGWPCGLGSWLPWAPLCWCPLLCDTSIPCPPWPAPHTRMMPRRRGADVPASHKQHSRLGLPGAKGLGEAGVG